MLTCILGLLCSYLWCNSSFSVIHKVSNIGISVQSFMEINWKQLRTLSVSKQLTFVIVLWIVMKVTDFSIHHLFKFKGIPKCHHCQLCVLWENSIVATSYVLNTRHARSFTWDFLSSFYCNLYPEFVYSFVFFKNCLHKLTYNSWIVISVSLLSFFVP